MSVLRFEWDRVTRHQWQALLARTPCSGLQQGWAYGEALAASGVAVHRLVAYDDDGGVAVGCAQLAMRRLLGVVPAAFLLRGPVWSTAIVEPGWEPALIAAVRARAGGGFLIWAPETLAASRRRRPVVTGYSTSWLDLDRPTAVLRRSLHGKWRHQLGQAERRSLEVQSAGREEDLPWLLAANEAQRRKVGYRGPGPVFLARLAHAAAASGDHLLLIAREGGEPVAGILLIRHGAAATYEVGHVTARGRQLGAKHLLLWHALGLLAERGVRRLDLGGIDTERAPGLARFKLGLGGEVRTLPGTFLVSFCRHNNSS